MIDSSHAHIIHFDKIVLCSQFTSSQRALHLESTVFQNNYYMGIGCLLGEIKNILELIEEKVVKHSAYTNWHLLGDIN